MAPRPVHQLRQMIHQQGIVRTGVHVGEFVVERVADRWEDWRLGVHTGQRISPQALGVQSPDAEKYAPSDYRSLRRALAHINIRPGQDALLDYGSGMGRVLIAAAQLPFQRVYGLELSAQLNALARANLRRADAHLKCHDIVIVEENARRWVVPPDVTVVWFYSPFGGPTLGDTLHRLRESWQAHPRQLTILFKDPHELEGQVPDHPWLHKTDELHRPGDHDRRRIVVYSAG